VGLKSSYYHKGLENITQNNSDNTISNLSNPAKYGAFSNISRLAVLSCVAVELQFFSSGNFRKFDQFVL